MQHTDVWDAKGAKYGVEGYQQLLQGQTVPMMKGVGGGHFGGPPRAGRGSRGSSAGLVQLSAVLALAQEPTKFMAVTFRPMSAAVGGEVKCIQKINERHHLLYYSVTLPSGISSRDGVALFWWGWDASKDQIGTDLVVGFKTLWHPAHKQYTQAGRVRSSFEGLFVFSHEQRAAATAATAATSAATRSEQHEGEEDGDLSEVAVLPTESTAPAARPPPPDQLVKAVFVGQIDPGGSIPGWLVEKGTGYFPYELGRLLRHCAPKQ
jgi:hypothetical protein